jgi:hypothetical protein
MFIHIVITFLSLKLTCVASKYFFKMTGYSSSQLFSCSLLLQGVQTYRAEDVRRVVLPKELSAGITLTCFLSMHIDFAFSTCLSPSIFKSYMETFPYPGRSPIWSTESCRCYYHIYAWKCKKSPIQLHCYIADGFPLKNVTSNLEFFCPHFCRLPHSFTPLNP